MSKHTHVWTWPIAGYLFLGGLGAGMTIIATVADLFFDLGFFFIPCALGAIVALGLGSFLLIFELGRPFQFWRVFSREKAILTFGAWMVISLVIFSIIYLSFWFTFIPWHGVVIFRQIIAVICLLLGCGVLIYTGVELSSMKARVFWNTPALPILFALSGLLAGIAANFLIVSVWPYTWNVVASNLSTAFDLAEVQAILTVFMAIMTVMTLVVTMIYALIMYTSATSGAKIAAARWLKGSYSAAFWGGLIIVGLVVPLVLLAFGSVTATLCASICIIVGGVCLRFLVVYNDDRRMLNGEALFEKRLPNGDEAFLSKNW